MLRNTFLWIIRGSLILWMALYALFTLALFITMWNIAEDPGPCDSYFILLFPLVVILAWRCFKNNGKAGFLFVVTGFLLFILRLYSVSLTYPDLAFPEMLSKVFRGSIMILSPIVGGICLVIYSCFESGSGAPRSTGVPGDSDSPQKQPKRGYLKKPVKGLVYVAIMLLIPGFIYLTDVSVRYRVNVWFMSPVDWSYLVIEEPDGVRGVGPLRTPIAASLEVMGKPDEYRCRHDTTSGYQMTFSYSRYGLQLSSFSGEIRGMTVDFNEQTIHRLRFHDHKALSEIPTVEQVESLYGKPDAVDEDTIAYQIGGHEYHFTVCDDRITRLWITTLRHHRLPLLY